MMYLRHFIFILLWLVITASHAVSRDELWGVMTLHGSKDRYLYLVEPHARVNEQGNPLDQFIARMGLGYQLSEQWRVWQGIDYVTNAQDATPNLQEMRLWQQLSWKHEANSRSLFSRTRLEERKALNFSAIATRVRERILFQWAPNHYFKINVFDEFFFNLNRVVWITSKTFDQNRAYIGIEPSMHAPFSFGVGYLNQYITTPVRQYNQVLLVSMALNCDML